MIAEIGESQSADAGGVGHELGLLPLSPSSSAGGQENAHGATTARLYQHVQVLEAMKRAFRKLKFAT
jgi:hypothetical protein